MRRTSDSPVFWASRAARLSLLLCGALRCGSGLGSFDHAGLCFYLIVGERRLTETWGVFGSGGSGIERGSNTRF